MQKLDHRESVKRLMLKSKDPFSILCRCEFFFVWSDIKRHMTTTQEFYRYAWKTKDHILTIFSPNLCDWQSETLVL